jgi:3-oxoadipate enol-lactonase
VSFGGSVAMALAVRHPERVDRLVLADCSADYGPGREENWAQRAVTAATVPRREQFAAQKTRWFSDGFMDRRPDVLQAFEDMFVACAPGAHAAACRALGGLSLLGELPAVAAPTLVVVGRDDPGTPVSMAEAIAGRISGSRLKVADGGKHMAIFEHDELWGDIVAHLSVTRP